MKLPRIGRDLHPHVRCQDLRMAHPVATCRVGTSSITCFILTQDFMSTINKRSLTSTSQSRFKLTRIKLFRSFLWNLLVQLTLCPSSATRQHLLFPGQKFPLITTVPAPIISNYNKSLALSLLTFRAYQAKVFDSASPSTQCYYLTGECGLYMTSVDVTCKLELGGEVAGCFLRSSHTFCTHSCVFVGVCIRCTRDTFGPSVPFWED